MTMSEDLTMPTITVADCARCGTGKIAEATSNSRPLSRLHFYVVGLYLSAEQTGAQHRTLALCGPCYADFERVFRKWLKGVAVEVADRG
jgi:hypothetical protein